MNFCNSNYKLPGEILEMPEMLRVRQRFDGGGIDDIPRKIRQECEKLPLCDLAGKRVAVTAGSRGIANIVAVTKTVVGFLLEKGACPFIVPAMGSHGGGTAEGQTAVLAHYGITPQSMGVPIVSSMQTCKIGQTPSGADIYCDAAAFGAGHIVAVEGALGFQGRLRERTLQDDDGGTR